MTGILDALRADSVRPGGICATCRWLLTRPAKEREEWREAYTDRSYTVAKIARLQMSMGGPGVSSVETHRRGRHYE